MKKTKIIILRGSCILFFLLLTYCILTHSGLSLYYAFTGLELWYRKMIPALLPFMILSGVMVRMELTEGFTSVVYPLIDPLFRVRRNVCYVMLMGFLCGFPMGAKCVNDLYSRGKITESEADFLLAFCNNIGPVYFCGFVLPLLGREKIAPYAFGMYGLPLLYGLLLRYTCYRGLLAGRTDRALSTGQPANETVKETFQSLHFAEHLEDAILSSLQSMAMLGGYMIFFNLLNLLPHLLTGTVPKRSAPLLEITGGLQMLGNTDPLYALIVLPFGGLSCIAQTYSCIKDNGLSMRRYVGHKLILTALTIFYYMAWRHFFPAEFLA